MRPTGPSPRLPPPLAGGTPVLISQIPLPPVPSISYAKYVAVGDHQQQHKTVELARQRIVHSIRQRSSSVLDSLLPVVCIGKEEAALWLFAIGSGGDGHTQPGGGKAKGKAGTTSIKELEVFAFDGLQRCHFSQFVPSMLYPCSSECASLQTPCSSCSSTTPNPSVASPPAPSPATTLPRVPLRPIYALFADAVRDRLIDDICAIPAHSAELKVATADAQTCRYTTRATRLGNGFLSIGDYSSPAWGTGWEHRSRRRPLVHTALHVSLSSSAIHIRPLPTLTTLLSFPVCPTPPVSLQPSTSTTALCTSSVPLTPGSPLILAPYQTPAFYMSTHLGTSISSSLLARFWDAMAGLGAYSLPKLPWTSSPRSASSSPNSKSPSPVPSSKLMREPFILVFVSVMNPQGEPKGLTALWPAHLVFIDTSTGRSHLTDFPEMPGTEGLLTPPRRSGSQSTMQRSLLAATSLRVFRRHSGVRSSYRVSRTQRAFRAMELSSHKRVPGVPIPATAKQAAGYVDSVAREREKERERANQERMRREREIKEGRSSGSGPSAPINISADASQVSQVIKATPVADPSSSTAPAGLIRTATSTSILSTFFSKTVPGTDANSFYPSPPDWDPIASASHSGAAEISSLVPNAPGGSNLSPDVNSTSSSQSQPGPNVAPQTISDTLDLGNGMNLGMDIDMTMNMGINLNDSIGFDIASDMDAAGIMDGTFGSFTDDDFNYFDSAPAGIPISAPHIQNSLQDLGAAGTAVDGWLANELQEGNTATNVLQEVTPTSIEADTTRHDPLRPHQMNDIHMSVDDGDLLPSAPDLIPSSPTKSPWSPGNPPTPSLELNAPPPPAGGKWTFEPIVFGKSHLLADGKYRDVSGKFAFSPLYSPQSTLVPGSPSSLGSDKDDGWKLRYDAVTDPRVGVVKRLRGVKRKLPQMTTQHGKVVRRRARDEEWVSLCDDDDSEVPISSSSESEHDYEEPEHAQDHDDEASSISHPSRPSTPPPAGLSLTATLLYTHFHHAHLLPMGVPLRTSYGDLVSPADPPPVPISVPTPVSPAAGLGNTSERNKALELIAQAVAKEAVENDVWAEAWAVSPDAPPDGESATLERRVSQTDLRRISELLRKVDGLQGSVPLSDLLEPPLATSSTAVQSTPGQGNKLHLMHPPRLSIGRAGLVHCMLPPAIRFWEKEGLGPRGGAKDVVAFALFEDGEERSALVQRWMERVSRAYTARGLGTHVAGNAGSFERGLVPVQFEAVRKTLSTLMVALPSDPPHIVLYIIAPPSVSFSIKSPALRTIIMSQKRVPKLAGQHDFDQDRVLVHFVPDYLVADAHTYPTTRYVGLERFVTSVYDRLLRPTLRQTSRQFWECNPPFENRFQVPAYVLARKVPPQTQFEWDERPSLNVLDRHTFLQVGYRVSACGKWLVAACIDERGEAHDVAVWGVPDAPAMNVNWVVSNIWIFVRQFAQRADTEWRIVVAKMGEMGENEVKEWMSHLETVASAHHGPPVHVSLVCAQNDIPLLFMSSQDAATTTPTNIPTNPNSVFTDVSSTTYSAFLPQRTPIISPDLFCPANHASLITPAMQEDDTDASLRKSAIGVLPLCTTALFHVPNETDLTAVSTLYIHLLHVYKSAKSTLKRTTHEIHADITHNWYELSVLTRERWHFTQHEELPFHLAALQVMSDVLNPLTSAPDMPAKDAEFLGS